MNKEQMALALIVALKEMGAKFVKATDESLFFEIPKGSEIDDDKKLHRAAEALRETAGMSLRIKRTS